MPTCNQCTSPCNCSIEEDGFWANRPQDGRRNVVVSGSGSLLDPITISFMQSEVFRPEAAELQVSSMNVASAAIIQADEYDISVYRTPNQVLIKANASPVQPLVTLHNYYMVGASATFAANATGVRLIEIATADNTNSDNETRIAGNIQTAVATSSSTLTCSGFAPGFLNPNLPDGGIVSQRSTPLRVAVAQTSGGSLLISQIKLWVVMI